MSTWFLNFTDSLLYVVHIVVIGINLFGWIFKKLRKIQLTTISATILSWFLFGYWYGWGYCFLTDWEWSVKSQIGEKDLPNSFIHYLSNNSLGLDLEPGLLDFWTVLLFILAIIASIIVNYQDFKRNKKASV